MPFSRQEYLGRIKRTRERMARDGIDVMLVSGPANINYLTGYDGHSFYVHQAVVVAPDRVEPTWIGREQDINGAELTSFLSTDSIVGYPDDYVQSPRWHPMSFVAGKLHERGLAGTVIGVESDSPYFTGRSLDVLREELPKANFRDGTWLVNWVRAVKSPQEIAYMREAARIVEKGMTTAFETIAPGVRQCDAVAEIERTLTRGTEEHGGDYPAIVPLMPTGKATAAPHITWSDAPYEADTATVIEIAGVRHRYHCPLTRTLYLGEPPRQMLDAAATVVDGIAAALDAVRPGVLAEDVQAAWRKAIEKGGIRKNSRIGYATGLGYPPDWGEQTISLREGDHTILAPNMTLHLLPGIWMDGWGVSISETIRVTETGVEVLTDVERKLWVKP